MKLLTKEQERKLRRNREVAVAAAVFEREPIRSVVKLFGGSTATWVLFELDADGDTAWGVADLFDDPICREYGPIPLSELRGVRFPPLGLPIERDKWYDGGHTVEELLAMDTLVGLSNPTAEEVTG